MNKSSSRLLVPLVVFFVCTSAFFVTGKSFLAKKNIDQEVLIVGNLILFVVTLGAALVAAKGYSTDKHRLLRGGCMEVL